jgi:hypothetical protein
MKKRLSLPLAALFAFAALNHQDTFAFYPPGGIQWNQPVRPKKAVIKKILANQIDNLCAPKTLTMRGKVEVARLKKDAEKIVDRILDEKHFTTETAALNACQEAVLDKVTQLIASMVYIHAEEEAKKWCSARPPINPQLINKIDPTLFAQQLAEDMSHSIKKDCAQNNPRSLTKFFNGEIIKEVARRTEQNYKKQ